MQYDSLPRPPAVPARPGGGTRPLMNVSLSVEVLPESTLREMVDLLVRLVEAARALIIFVGAAWAFGHFLLAGIRGGGVGRQFNRIRLSLGRFLALGLEFQLAGDVLRPPSRRASPRSGSSP